MSQPSDFPVARALKYLRTMVKQWRMPPVSQLAQETRDPFKILVSTVLSSRTKDDVTAAATKRLFAKAATPQKMVGLTATEIARTIFPVGFYNTKARLIRQLCQLLIERYDGKVPDDLDELLKLPGVGRKTANLVVSLAFRKHGICVDTHVHRISNRWGILKTKTPAETEQELRQVLPRRYWIEFNGLLVTFGQNMCLPVSPLCSRCGLNKVCPKIGVTTHR